MDEDIFNMQVRKFLKKVGITSQRELERAVREAIASGTITGAEALPVSMVLRLPAIGVELAIEDTIALE